MGSTRTLVTLMRPSIRRFYTKIIPARRPPTNRKFTWEEVRRLSESLEDGQRLKAWKKVQFLSR